MNFSCSKYVIPLLLVLFIGSCENEHKSEQEQEALEKIAVLEELMVTAQSKSLDVTREETLLWFSKEFIKFANWDEANKEVVEKLFGYDNHFAKDKVRLAKELPDLERRKVSEMLDKGIDNLKKVIAGTIKRRPVNKIEWGNIEVADGELRSNGKPVFLFDYFSKTVGAKLTDARVYNDHLGAIFHGGQRLYEVNMDRAVNPFILNEDRTFNEKIELITEIPDTNVGFLILWNMGMPQWIHDKEPEVAKGRSLFTGFDIDNPLMRDVWSDVMKKTGELTRGKKVTQLGYILSNEPHWFSEKDHWTQDFKEMNSISSYTLQKFRNWLSNKYNSKIGELNENWHSSYTNFDSVEIEIPMDKSLRGQPIWYDWCRYNMDRSIEWFTYLQAQLHATNPEADTHIKIMPKMFRDDYRSHGIDLEALTDVTSMIGNDSKTMGGRNLRAKEPEKWEERYAYWWDELSLPYDFLESVAPDKININSETHFLSASAWKDLNTSPDYVRNVFWLATLQGMDAGISWFWARDPDGSPEDRLEGDLNFFDPALAGSYAGSANMQPQMVNEVAQVYMDMNSFSEEIMALRKQKRPLRIFHSETSAINKKHYMTEQFELYESLFFEGFPIGYATEKIIKKQEHSNWDVVVVYKTDHVTDSEFETLQAYLDKGGTIILDSNSSLTKNEYGALRNKTLTKGKGGLIVMDNDNLEALKAKAMDLVYDNLHEVVLTENNGTEHKGCTWRVVENEDGNHIVNILNIGKNLAKLKVSFKDGKKASCTDMLTGRDIGDEFNLKSNGVLLLEVKK
ncbi:alpha-amylase family protein [Flagellimonas algicola]|uniref:Glycoside hydrolase family 42 n=1 Tax=Flagellimonas algicola TaxID=2583815 RepID=A0ABY2WQP9_9FLAO|nr:alpha-amylase family protein [Allomuricauda algicola]TMU57332.1 glycoside hydrolase family 42 [Allomuricauda algicola]